MLLFTIGWWCNKIIILYHLFLDAFRNSSGGFDNSVKHVDIGPCLSFPPRQQKRSDDLLICLVVIMRRHECLVASLGARLRWWQGDRRKMGVTLAKCLQMRAPNI